MKAWKAFLFEKLAGTRIGSVLGKLRQHQDHILAGPIDLVIEPIFLHGLLHLSPVAVKEDHIGKGFGSG